MTVDQLALFAILKIEASEMMYDVIYSSLKKGERKLYKSNKENILDKISLIYEYSVNGKTGERVSYLNFHSIFLASGYISSVIESENPLRIDRIILSTNFPSVELEDEDILLMRMIYIQYDGLDIPDEEELKKEVEKKLNIKSVDDCLKRISNLGILGFYPGRE